MQLVVVSNKEYVDDLGVKSSISRYPASSARLLLLLVKLGLFQPFVNNRLVTMDTVNRTRNYQVGAD